MSQKRIPITRKQHDVVLDIQQQVRQLNDRLSIVAQTILAGTDEVLTGQIGVTGADCADGVYALVLSVPDAPPAPPPSADAPDPPNLTLSS